jgi:hypothetical protein
LVASSRWIRRSSCDGVSAADGGDNRTSRRAARIAATAATAQTGRLLPITAPHPPWVVTASRI